MGAMHTTARRLHLTVTRPRGMQAKPERMWWRSCISNKGTRQPDKLASAVFESGEVQVRIGLLPSC